MHVRYLGVGFSVLSCPREVLEDYIRLFPNRPLLPYVRSVVVGEYSSQWLHFLLRSSTPAENQHSVSVSTLRHLHVRFEHPWVNVDRDFIRDLAAFQRSNGEHGGGLEVFKETIRIPSQMLIGYSPVDPAYRESVENALVLSTPETVDSPVHGLRRLETNYHIRDLPDFFVRVAKMRTLEYLRITILRENLEEEDEEGTMSENGVPPHMSSIDQNTAGRAPRWSGPGGVNS